MTPEYILKKQIDFLKKDTLTVGEKIAQIGIDAKNIARDPAAPADLQERSNEIQEAAAMLKAQMLDFMNLVAKF